MSARKQRKTLMPLRRKIQKKLRTPEWQVSSFMMDRALEAVVRQISKLDRNHDIPYLAGYSKNGKTIYIDRHMPKSFLFRRRRIKTDRYLILHEAVEKTLMDHLGLRYLHAHQMRPERSRRPYVPQEFLGTPMTGSCECT
jgi:hypothetical protein